MTLIFSLRRHREIAEAYLRGLERFVAAGGDPSRVHSVASFFVSRVDSETDRRLAAAGRDDLKGRLGIANAKLAYQQYKGLFTGDVGKRWPPAGRSRNAVCGLRPRRRTEPARHALRRRADRPGDDLDNACRNIEGLPRSRPCGGAVESELEEARYVFNQLYAAGVDYHDVVATLEREGIDKFVASFNELLRGIAVRRQLLVSAA